MSNLLDAWYLIGKKNPWISEAYDPEFTKKSLHNCHDLTTLFRKIANGNWCLGQGFYYENICLINQCEGGDEWLMIVGTDEVDSLSLGRCLTGEKYGIVASMFQEFTGKDLVFNSLKEFHNMKAVS